MKERIKKLEKEKLNQRMNEKKNQKRKEQRQQIEKFEKMVKNKTVRERALGTSQCIKLRLA